MDSNLRFEKPNLKERIKFKFICVKLFFLKYYYRIVIKILEIKKKPKTSKGLSSFRQIFKN